MEKFTIPFRQFNYKNEIIIFFILFLVSANIAVFQYLEWENSEEKIKHNALALFSGDEPFYLEVVSSITRSQSVSISAHFTSLEKDPFLELPPLYYEVHSCRLHHSLLAADGECYLPNIGFPVILAPAYALVGFVGSMLTISLLFSFQGVILYKISNKFTSKKLGFFLTLLVSFSTISLSFSTEIYPDFVGGFFLLLIFYFFYFRATNFLNISIVGFSLGFLALIKSYLLFFPLLLIPIMILILLKNQRYNNIFHLIASFTIFLLIFLSVSVLIAPVEVTKGIGGGYLWLLSQSFSNPSNLINLIENIGVGIQSLLFDQSTGLIAFSPILLVSIFGIKYVWKKDKFLTISIVTIVFSFISIFALTSPYAGGWSLPSRNIIPILPIMLIPFFSIFERFKHNIPFHLIILFFSYVGVSLNIIFARTIYGHFTVEKRQEILSNVYGGISQYFPQLKIDWNLPYPHVYESIHPLFLIIVIVLLFFFVLFTFSTNIKYIFKNKKYKIIFFILLFSISVPISLNTLNSYNDYSVENELFETYYDILKREPSSDEIVFYKNSLLNKEITIEELKESLSRSDEGIIVDKVSKIYQNILQREPDMSGLDHWKEKILNDEIDFKELEEIIKNTPEAVKINAN
jgi:hypothetical protein